MATPVGDRVKREKTGKLGGIFRRDKAHEKTSRPSEDEPEPMAMAVPLTKPVKLSQPYGSTDSLRNLVEEALSNNPELHSVRQDEIVHLARGEAIGAAGLPQLSFYRTHYSQPASATGLAAGSNAGSERDASGLLAEQPLLDWGESRKRIEMERFSARSSHWNAKVKELEIVYRVTEAYWRLVFFREVVDLRQAAVEAKKRERAAVGERVEGREARRVELFMVDAETAGSEQELLRAENGCDMARAQLLFYLGRHEDDLLCVEDRLILSDSGEQRSTCLDDHPEMKRVRSAEISAAKAEGAARAARFPKVVFRGQVEDSDSKRGPGTTNLVPDGTNYELGAFVSIPLGRQWTEATARVNEAIARRIQLEADAKTLNQSLRLRIKDAHNRLEEALKSVTVAHRNEMAAVENLKLRKEMALIKNATRAEVAEAESRYNDARIGVFKALYDVKEAQAHLDRELGLFDTRCN